MSGGDGCLKGRCSYNAGGCPRGAEDVSVADLPGLRLGGAEVPGGVLQSPQGRGRLGEAGGARHSGIEAQREPGED